MPAGEKNLQKRNEINLFSLGHGINPPVVTFNVGTSHVLAAKKRDFKFMAPILKMPEKKSHWRYIVENVWHREYLWRYSIPTLLLVFAAWVIFHAEGYNNTKIQLEKRHVVISTLDAELGVDILIADDLNKRASILIKEVERNGQRYFSPEIVDEMQKLACGQLAEYFVKLKNDNRTDNYVCLLHLKNSLSVLKDYSSGDRTSWIKAAKTVILRSQDYIRSAKLLQSSIQYLK